MYIALQSKTNYKWSLNLFCNAKQKLPSPLHSWPTEPFFHGQGIGEVWDNDLANSKLQVMTTVCITEWPAQIKSHIATFIYNIVQNYLSEYLVYHNILLLCSKDPYKTWNFYSSHASTSTQNNVSKVKQRTSQPNPNEINDQKEHVWWYSLKFDVILWLRMLIHAGVFCLIISRMVSSITSAVPMSSVGMIIFSNVNTSFWKFSSRFLHRLYDFSKSRSCSTLTVWVACSL